MIPGTERKTGVTIAEQVAGADLVITSFALFRLDEEAHRSVRWWRGSFSTRRSS